MILVAGCGGKSDTPPPSRAGVVACVGDRGFLTSEIGNVLHVEKSHDRRIAEIRTFFLVAEAKKFNSMVKAPHAFGGSGVAVWRADAKRKDKLAITACLTP